MRTPRLSKWLPWRAAASPRLTQERREGRERGAALVMVVVFSFMAIAFTGFLLTRTQVELNDSRLKAAKVKSLFQVNSALARAHREINVGMDSSASMAAGQNVELTSPESYSGKTFVKSTNHAVRIRSEKPSNVFDADGNELPPVDADGVATDYEELPWSWYCIEARICEPMFSDSNGQKWGQLKVARQYVRDGTPLSNNFLAVVNDDLGLGGSALNPGKPAEGEIHTNKHLYIMTSNPYYANRLLAVQGVSYTAGATQAGTVYLHPDNNFSADPLYLPLPSSLTANASDPDDTLKSHALGSSPTTQPLTVGTANGMTTSYNKITAITDLKKTGSDPMPTVKVNMEDGVCRGVCVEGYVNTDVVVNGSTMTLTLSRYGDATKYAKITNVPVPVGGVIFFDTRVDVGGTVARTSIKGSVSTRTTLATTGNVDIVGSVRYMDSDGDYATKMAYTSALSGVSDANLGKVSEIPETTKVKSTDSISYFANTRPPGVSKTSGDGFYDNDAVLGVVASQDVIFTSSLPENGEISGSYLSLQKRLTLEGLTYNAAGQLSSVNGSSPFYNPNGGRASLRRFGGMISYLRPCTTVVTGSGSFYYGFKTGFSLFDENMKQKPPPFFPKDKKPMYLGWELKDLGVKPIAQN